MIRRAVKAGCRPRSFMLAPRWLDSLRDVLNDAPVYLVSEATAEAVSGFHVHRGALASLHRESRHTVADLLASRTGRSRIAVLEDLVDHANVGAVFRSAAALGVDAVLVTPQCADPLYERDQGQYGGRPAGAVDPDRAMARRHRAADGRRLRRGGHDPGGGAITLDELVAEDHQRLALVFGTEGHGLLPGTDARLDRRVTIPMMAGIDSLNVAASSAVAFYATR